MYFSKATYSLFLFKSHNEIRCKATFLILDLKDEGRKKSEILLTTNIKRKIYLILSLNLIIHLMKSYIRKLTQDRSQIAVKSLLAFRLMKYRLFVNEFTHLTPPLYHMVTACQEPY